jgi:hypothetical protein
MAGDLRYSLIISLLPGKSAIAPSLDRVAGPERHVDPAGMSA